MSQSADIIKKRSPWWFNRIASAFERLARRNFQAMRIAKWGLPPADFTSLAIGSNHPGWWDPVVFVLLHKYFFFKYVSYGPMDLDALRRYPFLGKLGIFGIEPDSANGARLFLSLAKKLFNQGNVCLWVTLPGRFQDVREVPFIKLGLIHAVCSAGKNVMLVPLAIEYVFWNEKLPEILVAFGDPVPVTEDRNQTQVTFQGALLKTMQRLSLSAQSRDPDQFQSLWEGKKGIAFFYDALRALLALIKGERYVATHGLNKHD